MGGWFLAAWQMACEKMRTSKWGLIEIFVREGMRGIVCVAREKLAYSSGSWRIARLNSGGTTSVWILDSCILGYDGWIIWWTIFWLSRFVFELCWLMIMIIWLGAVWRLCVCVCMGNDDADNHTEVLMSKRCVLDGGVSHSRENICRALKIVVRGTPIQGSCTSATAGVPPFTPAAKHVQRPKRCSSSTQIFDSLWMIIHKSHPRFGSQATAIPSCFQFKRFIFRVFLGNFAELNLPWKKNTFCVILVKQKNKICF